MKNIQDSVTVAEAYYQAAAAKDFESMENFLHPDVVFVSPVREVQGRDAMLVPAKEFANSIKELTVRARVGSGNQAALVQDIEFIGCVGKLRTAAVVTVENGLITRLELFFDRSFFSK